MRAVGCLSDCHSEPPPFGTVLRPLILACCKFCQRFKSLLLVLCSYLNLQAAGARRDCVCALCSWGSSASLMLLAAFRCAPCCKASGTARTSLSVAALSCQYPPLRAALEQAHMPEQGMLRVPQQLENFCHVPAHHAIHAWLTRAGRCFCACILWWADSVELLV